MHRFAAEHVLVQPGDIFIQMKKQVHQPEAVNAITRRGSCLLRRSACHLSDLVNSVHRSWNDLIEQFVGFRCVVHLQCRQSQFLLLQFLAYTFGFGCAFENCDGSHASKRSNGLSRPTSAKLESTIISLTVLLLTMTSGIYFNSNALKLCQSPDTQHTPKGCYSSQPAGSQTSDTTGLAYTATAKRL